MEFYTYSYVPKNIEITLDKNYTFQDGIVTYLNIMHDYINRRLPIIQMGIELSAELIKLVYDYKNTAKLKFDLYEYQKDGTGKLVSTQLYFRKTFTIVPAKDKTSYITSTDITSQKNVDVMKNLQEFEFYLIDMSMVNIFNQQLTFILQNASCPEALQAIFTMRNIQSKTVIATPPMQTSSLSNILIPLGDMITNINSLNKNYGLYDSIPIIYHDIFALYCINKVNPNILINSSTDFSNITFILKNVTDPSHLIMGSYTDNNSKTHYINLQNEPSIYDKTIQDTSTKFSTLATVDSTGTVSKTTIDSNSSTLNYSYSYNTLTSKQIINEYMTGPSINIGTSNCGLSFIKPYKNFMFNVDSQYSNLNITNIIYRLQSFSISIYRDGKNNYLHDVSLVVYNPNRS